jgi:hypothetical protein
MGQLGFSWGTIAVCSLLSGLLPSCNRSADQVSDAAMIQRTNAALSSRKLPVLPVDVTDVRCWTGGTFAKYMNVKFTASPDQALDYLRRASATHYLEFEIEGKNYRILATHLLTAAAPDSEKPELYCLTNKTGILSQPWFKSVYDIRHGWYYHYYRDAPARYNMYYDVDNQQFYV